MSKFISIFISLFFHQIEKKLSGILRTQMKESSESSVITTASSSYFRIMTLRRIIEYAIYLYFSLHKIYLLTNFLMAVFTSLFRNV